ncbi:uncharacterized protein si:ch211-57n23.1 [Cololabis saira]|uniref:uncharacterized protein si:ch211-57n23.1 n=1 Tax=Cololabis saira TaxID=129043 RepID=UPI002AD25D74|nr:uncharacterized protein si:ch211-57n23.1 [Cololabis saira]
MLWWTLCRAWLCLSCCFLLGVCSPDEDPEPAGPLLNPPPEEASGESDQEDWKRDSGSSFPHVLHSFLGDSPFPTEAPENPINCTQRFWLPPSSPICWENIAGPKEFSRSRLLVLQNRAALQAVSSSSGVEEEGISYNHQATEEVQGIRSDHQMVVDTIQDMETVFVSLGEKRREGTEQRVLTSMKELLADTRDALDGRGNMVNHLESRFATLEKTLLLTQHRLNKLFQQ